MSFLFKRYLLLTLALLVLIPQVAFSQAAGGGGGDDLSFVDDTKNDLLVVTACGLGGAVLGLSTLSFVEEPKKHTRNIIVGAALGIIVGVGIVAFNQANKSKDMFFDGEEGGEGGDAAGAPAAYFTPSEKFDTKDRLAWHNDEQSQFLTDEIPQVGLNFAF